MLSISFAIDLLLLVAFPLAKFSAKKGSSLVFSWFAAPLADLESVGRARAG
jgi:hypothetical protein